MNRFFSKQKLVGLLWMLLASTHAFAMITESDKQLNKNIKDFTPIYCKVRSIPWEYWDRRYEFVLALTEDERLSPTPPSDLSNEFLGYKNTHTKIKLLCNKLEPVFGRLMSSKVIASFEVDDFSKKLFFLIDDLEPQKKVEIALSVARGTHDIEVVESRNGIKIFKAYKPARVFNVSLDVKDISERDTIGIFF